MAPIRFRNLLPWPTALWLSFLPGLLPAAGHAELTVLLQSGIGQNRNYEREGTWSAQLARRLPPASAPFVLVAQGPEEWVADERPSATATEVATLNAEHARAFLAALSGQNLLSGGDPLLAAGRVVALLRPMEIDRTAPSRYARVWPLWEVLAFSTEADTLSASVAAVQVLESAGVPARVARYPSVLGVDRFGVVISGAASRVPATPGAQRVGADALLPSALSAKPVDRLQPDEVDTWSWQEILSPGWKGSGPGSRSPAASATNRGRRILSLPDLCRQAAALDLECVPVAASRSARDQTMLALSALALAILAGWLGALLHQRRLRIVRVRRLQEDREESPL